MSSPDPEPALEALRAAAIAKREAEAKENTARVTEARDRQIDDGRRATSAIGVMATKAWFAVVLALSIPGVLFAVLGLLIPTKRIVGGTINTMSLPIGLGTLGLALALAIVIALARSAVRASAVREEAWLASLPFKLTGHWKLLATGYGAFTLTFQGAAPDEAFLEPLVVGTSAFVLELDLRGSITIKIKSPRQTLPPHRVWHSCHRLVDELLIPLHGRYPIAAVSFY